MSASERCLAAHVEDVTPCGGPVRAVRIVDWAGTEVTGCVRHGAVLLASLEGGRVYPGPQTREGDAIEVFERAQTLSPFSFEVADEELSTPPVPVSEGSQVSGEEVGPGANGPNLAATGAGAAAVPPVPVVAQPPQISDEMLKAFADAFNACPMDASGQHPACCTKAGLAAALRVALRDPAHQCTYAAVYFDAQKALDELLGPNEEDGCGGGMVAEIWHLARRCEHFEQPTTPEPRWGSGPLVDHNPETLRTQREMDADLYENWVANQEAGTGSADPDGLRYPRFSPDAVLVVDAHNGPERWTGQRWNDYVAAAERSQSMVTARLLEVDERAHAPGTGSADPDGGQR